jgi:putative endopeptidase
LAWCISFAVKADLQVYDHLSGLDSTGRDNHVRVQDDLFLHMNGQWIKDTEIPKDKSSYGAFVELSDLSDQRVKGLIEALSESKKGLNQDERKVVNFYQAFLDTDAIDALGLVPIQALLNQIQAIKDRHQLAFFLGSNQHHFNVPIRLMVGPDDKEPNINRLQMAQGGLGLPDRDYYLKLDEPRFAKARQSYLLYLSQLARLSPSNGDRDPSLVAAQTLELESQLAQVHWSQVEMRDAQKTYNPMTIKALMSKTPRFDWPAFMKGAQLSAVKRLIVEQPSSVIQTTELLMDKPLEAWKAYLVLHVLSDSAQVLPQAFRDAHFAFYGQALSGAKTQKPRWQLAVAHVDEALGEAVGRLYVQRYFPPEHKAQMIQLVNNLFAAYKDSIQTLTWMGDATKKKALEKLSKYSVKIAYPNRFRNYSALQVRPHEAWANAMQADQFEWARMVQREGKAVDRGEWAMTPQTVNAYYNASQNEIVFPAAILQPPFFNPNADAAVNYGAIGSVIGHEISHGFDDQGSQYGGDGKLANWWTDADRAAFDKLTQQLVEQFDAYEPLPGVHVQGALTLGENIADLSGLEIAYKAYVKSLKGNTAAEIDGLTGDQRFFLGYAQAWRSKVREESILRRLTSDPHSPDEFRANGSVINVEAFHKAFNTQVGDKMYKSPKDRIRIW